MNKSFSNNRKSNLLSLEKECDILALDSVLDELTMAKQIEYVKKVHPYSITPPANENGRWQTRYRDADGNYKSIKAPTEEQIWKKLATLYFSNEHIEKLTFYGLYEEWIDYKKDMAGSPNTITRHKQHYRKYLESSALHGKKLNQLDSLTLEKECNQIVKNFNLSRKEWTNVKTILLGMFEYAVRKSYISTNPMSDVKILVKYRQVVKKTGKSQTYNTEELEELNRYLDAKYTETGDTAFLAVKVNFMLGLRVGELTALKWTDWETSRSLHVMREEVREQENNLCYVADHTKTHQDRYVAVPPKAIEILESIPKQGEYIFMRNGNRITSRQVAYVLEKYAERNGLKTKSTHKMRKTYASRLASNGVPLDAIRELLGHTDLQTTLGYIYNPLTEKDTYERICNAL